MRSLFLKPFLIAGLLLLPGGGAQAVEAHQSGARDYQSAILAGGCFWCVEADFEKLDGVIDAVSGYTGGHVANPTYEQVSSGRSGHVEAVRITFDPAQISYARILDYFWHNIDPTRNDGQFCDRGTQYRPVIFYLDENQKSAALASQRKIADSKPFPEPLKVELLAASKFWPAEAYHQDYAHKNPLRYRFYRYSCGRDARIESLWSAAD